MYHSGEVLQAGFGTSLSEKFLAVQLRRLGVSFQQQAPIGRYNVDFLVGPDMIVEAEGKVHSSTQEHDARRTSILENLGYRVFRIPNYLIFQDPRGIAEMIRTQVKTRKACYLSDVPAVQLLKG